MDIFLALLGLVILVLAGDLLVRGAVNLSLRLGIPALIVSLTIVAIGTSAPELLISIDAVMAGAPGIAVGNVVGSNTANVLLVLGVPALIFGLGRPGKNLRSSYVQMLLGTALFVGLTFFAPLNWGHGIVLLGLYILFMVFAIVSARTAMNFDKTMEQAADDIDGAEPCASWLKIVSYLGLGIIGLPLGADILVGSATSIARSYGMSETIIGLTLIAVGTSLPELATTISAALRRQVDVALGNVVGSNMANLLAIVGTATFFGEIPISERVLEFDLWLMAAASLALVPFVMFRIEISRIWGFVFTALYVTYVACLLT